MNILRLDNNKIVEFISGCSKDYAINYILENSINSTSTIYYNIESYLDNCGSYKTVDDDYCIIDAEFDLRKLDNLGNNQTIFFKERFQEFMKESKKFIRELKINELGL